MRSYFIWKNINCLNMHTHLRTAPSIIRPEERTEQITIPGRSGQLTLTEGEDVFESYIQTVNLTVIGAEHVREVEKWLAGAGEVTFSPQPNLKQNARVIGAVTLERISRNMDRWSGDVQFYCDPIKHLRESQDITLTEYGAAIMNPGDLAAKPMITITGSGAVTLRIGGNVLNIPECENGWMVDSLNEWIIADGVPIENACSGTFPVIPTGESIIQWTGNVTSLTISPEWRFL